MKLLSRTGIFFGAIGLALSMCSHGIAAAGQYTLSKGQTLYVPVYSNVFGRGLKMRQERRHSVCPYSIDP
jgi:hypothetical protein